MQYSEERLEGKGCLDMECCSSLQDTPMWGGLSKGVTVFLWLVCVVIDYVGLAMPICSCMLRGGWVSPPTGQALHTAYGSLRFCCVSMVLTGTVDSSLSLSYPLPQVTKYF